MKIWAAKMQFLPLVGNAFLRKKKQPHFKNFARHWQIIFEKRLRDCYILNENNFDLVRCIFKSYKENSNKFSNIHQLKLDFLL